MSNTNERSARAGLAKSCNNPCRKFRFWPAIMLFKSSQFEVVGLISLCNLAEDENPLTGPRLLTTLFGWNFLHKIFVSPALVRIFCESLERIQVTRMNLSKLQGSSRALDTWKVYKENAILCFQRFCTASIYS